MADRCDLCVLQAEDAREINSWVAKATKKLITSVLPPGSVHGGTRLVLTNAIYFKGEWEEAFRRSRTKEHRFYRLDGSAVRVPFMAGFGGGDYRVGCHDGFKVLKLPYKQAANGGGGGARYSMCVFLPTAREGLPSLVDEMASNGLGFLFDHLPMWPRSVTKLRLPKFKLSFFCSMKNVLRSNPMGIHIINLIVLCYSIIRCAPEVASVSASHNCFLGLGEVKKQCQACQNSQNCCKKIKTD
ncbi:hypothetical protein ACQ4PT_004775 [Festuca glaucescens]